MEPHCKDTLRWRAKKAPTSWWWHRGIASDPFRPLHILYDSRLTSVSFPSRPSQPFPDEALLPLRVNPFCCLKPVTSLNSSIWCCVEACCALWMHVIRDPKWILIDFQLWLYRGNTYSLCAKTNKLLGGWKAIRSSQARVSIQNVLLHIYKMSSRFLAIRSSAAASPAQVPTSAPPPPSLPRRSISSHW